MFQISLEAARVNAKMTQKEVARAMKMNPATLIRWEKGKSLPSISQFQSLCDLYGCPIEAIFIPSKTT